MHPVASQIARGRIHVVAGNLVIGPGFMWRLPSIGPEPPGEVAASVAHGLTLGHNVTAEGEGVTATVAHGLTLGQSVEAETIVETSVGHGLILGHSATGLIGDGAEASISHGLTLGHAANIVVTADAQVRHGLTLGHSATAACENTAAVRHGLTLGHRIDGGIPTAARIRHGLTLGHRVDVHLDAPWYVPNPPAYTANRIGFTAAPIPYTPKRKA